MRLLQILIITFLILPSKAFSLEYFQTLGWLDKESKVNALVEYPEMVTKLYNKHDDQLIWLDLQQSTKLEFQLEIIHHAGFSPQFSDRLGYLQFYRKSNRWFEYDLLATDTLLLYLSYAEFSREQGFDWFFRDGLAKRLPLAHKTTLEFLSTAIERQQLSELIDIYTPNNDSYKQLVSTYLHLIKYHSFDLADYKQKGILRLGDKITERQTLMKRLQLVDIDLSQVKPDVPWYDHNLQLAVKQFQSMHGLKPDGVIGKDTIRWLNTDPRTRLKTLALNAERTRLWPEQRDTIILVNVPGYEMKYWQSGKEVFESKVVVGRKSRPTPLLQIQLDALILNPTWNVPYKIMVKDIIPKVKKDVSYLSDQQFQILTSWTDSSPIDPESIDWQSVNPRKVPFRLRQLSGDANALGRYKFHTPNNRAIYLHDTPSKHLFDEDMRAFSSGCIRVQHADEFAKVLVRTQGLDETVLQSPVSRANKSIPLKRGIPVHIIYQTAWYEEGVIHYRDDIYRFDKLSYTKS